MKHLIIILFIFFGFTSCKDSGEINLTTLLNEMIDREKITHFPQNGYQSLQASSYNRESVSPDLPGWFADSDGTGFIRTEEVNGHPEWVLMEDEGPGCITKIWAVCFYYGLNNTTGANIKFYLDGSEEPVINTNFFELVKGQDFVKPPFADSTARAGNLYFPVPYAKSCKITMDKKAFYNIINYRKYPASTNVKTFTMEEFASTAGLRQEVADVLITLPDAEGKAFHKEGVLEPGQHLSHTLPPGIGAVKQLEIQLSNADDLAQALRSVVLVGEFDGEQTIWAPVGDFFNNVGKIRPYDMWERSVKTNGTMVCRWVMPYQERGQITMKNFGNVAVKASLKIITDDWEWDSNSMHFYATWRMDEPHPTFPLFDWNFLEAEGKGVIVGDQWTVLNPREGWWGEGDEKIYIDNDLDKKFPSHFGTGTEDYYGWAGGIVPTPGDEFAKPFLGNIIVAHPNSMGYNVCTRTRALDAIPFRNRIKFDFEASCGTRQRWHYLQYAQTTFWYALPGAKHNRQPLPEMVSRGLPSLEWLQQVVEEAKKEQYYVDEAIEAENLKISAKSASVKENHANIPVWGEVSSGALKNLWFENVGDYAQLKITEQFKSSKIKMAAAVGRNCGKFEFYVNDQLKTVQDLYSNHEGITNPYIDLGVCEPQNNAFVIKMVYKGHQPDAVPVKGKMALGVDFFLVEN